VFLLKSVKEFGTGLAKIWPVGLVIGFGLASFLIGLKLSSQSASLLSTAMLAATLVAAAWYSLETRVLRLQQQRDSEVRNHPWLKGSDLKVTWDKEHGGLAGRDIVYLPVINVGTTPAQDVQITIRWRVEGNEPSSGEREIGGMVLMPGDTLNSKLCEIDWNFPDDRANIDVNITYRSFAGGGSRLKMNFYSHESGWANGSMSYEIWLSDGRRFPAAPLIKVGRSNRKRSLIPKDCSSWRRWIFRL